jgi:hypothetical protein
MKKFIFKTSIFSLLIFILLISVNYWGDSAKIFHRGYEKKIAELLFENHNVTNISNYDERILQKEIISKLGSSPDVLILGSSRIMLINSTYFKNKKVINNGVSGASIEDLIAIYQIYKSRSILPKKIILGIDPWLFNENNGQTRWHSLKKEYYSFSEKTVEVEKDRLNNKVKQLFSFSYFQASFNNIPNVISGKSEPIATDNIYNTTNTKLFDASLSYGKKFREVSDIEINNKAKNYIKGNIYSIEQFDKISPKIWDEFEYFCQEIIENDIELSFFLAPYHPIVYEEIEQNYKLVIVTENKVVNFAKENNIRCLGSFSPIKMEIDNKGFYDGMHSKEYIIKKIMKVQINDNEYKSLGKW